MQGEIKTGACLKQVLNFLIAFDAAEGFIKIGVNNLGNFESKSPCNLSSNQFRHQSLCSLTCPAEFEDVKKAIIRFDDRRQRSTFPQWRNISRDVYCPK